LHSNLSRIQSIFREFEVCQSGSSTDRRKSAKLATTFLDLIAECETLIQADNLTTASAVIERLQNSLSTEFDPFFRGASMDRFQKSQRIAEIGRSCDSVVRILTTVPSLSIQLPPEIHDVSKLIASLKTPPAKPRSRATNPKTSKIPVGRASFSKSAPSLRSKSVPKVIPSLLASRKSLSRADLEPPPEPPAELFPSETLRTAVRTMRRIENRCEKFVEVFGENEVLRNFLNEIEEWQNSPTPSGLDQLLGRFDAVEEEMGKMSVRDLLNFEMDSPRVNERLRRIAGTASAAGLYADEEGRLKGLVERFEPPRRETGGGKGEGRAVSPPSGRRKVDTSRGRGRAVSPPTQTSQTRRPAKKKGA
jgi:hypothetical protein